MCTSENQVMTVTIDRQRMAESVILMVLGGN